MDFEQVSNFTLCISVSASDKIKINKCEDTAKLKMSMITFYTINLLKEKMQLNTLASLYIINFLGMNIYVIS